MSAVRYLIRQPSCGPLTIPPGDQPNVPAPIRKTRWGLLTAYAGPEGSEMRMTGRDVPGVVAVLIGTLMAPSCGSAGDVAVATPGPAESEVPGARGQPGTDLRARWQGNHPR